MCFTNAAFTFTMTSGDVYQLALKHEDHPLLRAVQDEAGVVLPSTASATRIFLTVRPLMFMPRMAWAFP
jgi:hypothetical protein